MMIIGEETEISVPVLYYASASSAQATLQNTLLHTERKREFAVYAHDRSAVLFFYGV